MANCFGVVMVTFPRGAGSFPPDQLLDSPECSHRSRASPGVGGVVAVLPAIRDPQKYVPRPKSLPDVEAKTVQPKEGCQQAKAQDNVRHNEANMASQLGEDSHQIRRLADHQAHGYCCHYVAHQISAKWMQH